MAFLETWFVMLAYKKQDAREVAFTVTGIVQFQLLAFPINCNLADDFDFKVHNLR